MPAPTTMAAKRPGDNRFANSVTALDGKTGKVVWSFQTVHHDLWDYDVASQPLLFTMRRGGRGIPAVAIGSKTGHLFLVDRYNGKPLFPVEESAGAGQHSGGRESVSHSAVSRPASGACSAETSRAGRLGLERSLNSTGVESAFACCGRRAFSRLPVFKGR